MKKVNINRQQVDPVKEKLFDANSVLDSTLFDTVMKTVKINLMDTLFRFVKTSSYKNYMKAENVSSQMMKQSFMIT